MSDSPSAPAKTALFALFARRLIGVFVVVLLLAAIAILIYGQPSQKAWQTLNLSQAKGIFPALKLYAADHAGRYPHTLVELEPDYLSSIENTRYRDQDSRRHYDWLYILGLNESSPATWIVLASPTEQVFHDSKLHGRIVVRNDGSAEILPVAKFDEQLTAQLKAMAAQVTEKP